MLSTVCLLAHLSQLAAAPPANPRVLLTTSFGAIEIEVNVQKAPETSRNFLRYVDAGRYTDGRFHRTVTMGNQPDNKIKIEVIQGGVNPIFEKEDFPPILLERTNKTGLRHLDGTVSMARSGPDTATSDFFICIGAQPQLDFGGLRNPDGQGFAAFGQVTKGMEAVQKIKASKAEGQTLTPPIVIEHIERVRKQTEP